MWLAERCADHEGTQILRARLTNLQAAALLVIVGEVKVGKSSFVNALVHEEVCEVAPGPCTSSIQELVYGAERKVTSLGQYWERLYLPKEVLREITMVDTPGTNSIIQNHETITENYIPQSDLVVFVISAANPHTKSAWELLTLISKEWHRKMVFVLQQADRASEHELRTNLELVKQYARERHVENPTVFTLSAKLEMEGMPESGFSEFRNFLQNAIACGEVWRMKVEGSYETIRTVMTKLLAHLRAEKESIDGERAFYQDLLRKVEAREAKAYSLKLGMVEKLSATYENLARQSETEFAEGLRVGQLVRRAIPFLRDKNTETWLQDLKGRFERSARKELEIEAAQVSRDILDEMRAMMDEMAKSIARTTGAHPGERDVAAGGEALGNAQAIEIEAGMHPGGRRPSEGQGRRNVECQEAGPGWRRPGGTGSHHRGALSDPVAGYHRRNIFGDRHSAGRGRTALAPVGHCARLQTEAGRFAQGV